MENKNENNAIDFAKEIEEDNFELLQKQQEEEFRKELKEMYKVRFPFKVFKITMAVIFGLIMLAALIKTSVEYKSSSNSDERTQITEVVTYVF